MRLLRALLSSLAFVAVIAAAQSEKPGPMQSGAHTQPQADKPAGDNAAAAPQPGAPAGQFDVPKLFATSCGWCHLDGGRVAGRGPKLMGTQMTDAEIMSRIRNGKTGQMPAFGSTFNDDQLKAIVSYIRGLKAS
jgi:mono/diheme cytochrome c family protein